MSANVYDTTSYLDAVFSRMRENLKASNETHFKQLTLPRMGALLDWICPVRSREILGVLESVPEDLKRNYVNYLKGLQETDTGFVYPPDVAATEWKDKAEKETLHLKRCQTRNAEEILCALGERLEHSLAPGAMRFDRSREKLESYFSGYPWRDGPWGSGSKIGIDFMYFAHGARERLEEFEEYTRWGLDWLENKQDPLTGMWGGEGASANALVNGAMKIIAAVCYKLSWDLPRPEKVIDTCLRTLDDPRWFAPGKGGGCNDFDMFLCLDEALKHTDHRREECVDKTLTRISRMTCYLAGDGQCFTDGVADDDLREKENGNLFGTTLFLDAVAYALHYAAPGRMRELNIRLPSWPLILEPNELKRIRGK